MINKWIGNIIAVAILGVLLDMILPSGNLKTYTRFFVGLISILVIIRPLLNMNHELPEIEEFIWSQTMAMELESFNTQSHILQEEQDDYVMELYKDRLEEQITNQVKSFVQDDDLTVEIEFGNIDNGESYAVEGIDIIIGSSDHLKGLEIEPIEIGKGSGEQDNNGVKEQNHVNGEFDHIRQHLAHIYEIEESKIFIKTK